MPWPLNGNCLTESTMIYIFCSTTKQARQNVLFIGGHRILSPDVIISKIEGTPILRLLIKMFKSNASKNLQKIVRNSPKIALIIHPKNPPKLKEFFRTCNVLPFSCTHLALWKGKVKNPRYIQNKKDSRISLPKLFSWKIHSKNWPNSPSITKCTNSMRSTRSTR